MTNAQVREICTLTSELEAFLESVSERLCLSPRACQRILKVSRTVADMDGSREIEEEHLAEAVTYRTAGGSPATSYIAPPGSLPTVVAEVPPPPASSE